MNPLTYFAVFGAGVATLASPCVLPLLPAWITVVLDAGPGGRLAAIRSCLTFSAGFTSVFVAMGGLAGALGQAVGTLGRGLSQIGGGLLVILGLVLMGAAVGVVTRRWQALRQLPTTTARLRPLVLGAVFAAAWSPCVGPLLGAALVAAAGTGVIRGMTLLACYSLGLATPFLVLCLFGTAALDALPRVRAGLGRAGPTLQFIVGAAMVLLGGLLAVGLPMSSVLLR